MNYLAIALAALAPSAAEAQGDLVARADSLIAAGNYSAARGLLEEGRGDAEFAALAPARKARLLFLRARLNPDPQGAESDYLALVLGYPTAPEAPAALLYLGQGLHARGDYLRAAAYLERLVRDYPGDPHRGAGLLWLSRVQLAAQRPNEGCQTARQALAAVREPDQRALAESVQAASCAQAGGAPDRPYTPVEREVSRPEMSERGSFALQAGAFRRAEGADAVARRLRQAGFDPRIVFLRDSSLRHVRIGRFDTAAAAAEAARKLRAAGFDVVVVSDATAERSTP